MSFKPGSRVTFKVQCDGSLKMEEPIDHEQGQNNQMNNPCDHQTQCHKSGQSAMIKDQTSCKNASRYSSNYNRKPTGNSCDDLFDEEPRRCCNCDCADESDADSYDKVVCAYDKASDDIMGIKKKEMKCCCPCKKEEEKKEEIIKLKSITVIEALNLPKMDINSKTDCYVKIHCGKQEFRTKTIWNKDDAKWNEKFDVDDDNKVEKTFFQIYDEDKLSKDDLIAEITIVSRGLKEGKNTYSFPLHKDSFPVNNADGERTQLKLGIECVLVEQ